MFMREKVTTSRHVVNLVEKAVAVAVRLVAVTRSGEKYTDYQFYLLNTFSIKSAKSSTA